MYKHTYMCIYIYIYIYIERERVIIINIIIIRISISIIMYVPIICIYIYIYMHTYTHIYTCVYIYIYTCARLQRWFTLGEIPFARYFGRGPDILVYWETENYHVMRWFWAVFRSGDCFLIYVHSKTIT